MTWRVDAHYVDGERRIVLPQRHFTFLWRAKRYIRRNRPLEPIPGKPLYRLIIRRVP